MRSIFFTCHLLILWSLPHRSALYTLLYQVLSYCTHSFCLGPSQIKLYRPVHLPVNLYIYGLVASLCFVFFVLSLPSIIFGGTLVWFGCVVNCGCDDGLSRLLNNIFLIWYMHQSVVFFLSWWFWNYVESNYLPLFLCTYEVTISLENMDLNREVLKWHLSLLNRKILNCEDFLVLYYL